MLAKQAAYREDAKEVGRATRGTRWQSAVVAGRELIT
jgi:hypothetical protein